MAGTMTVHCWTVYSAVCLGRARFASVANLLLGGPRCDSRGEELPVAYDFLCDLYLETGREDVQRTAGSFAPSSTGSHAGRASDR